MIYADQRWSGDHGIGRFARHVLADIDYRPVALAGHPAAPLDALAPLGRAHRTTDTRRLILLAEI